MKVALYTSDTTYGKLVDLSNDKVKFNDETKQIEVQLKEISYDFTKALDEIYTDPIVIYDISPYTEKSKTDKHYTVKCKIDATNATLVKKDGSPDGKLTPYEPTKLDPKDGKSDGNKKNANLLTLGGLAVLVSVSTF